jgi:2-iminobutanoate/2-iminopropanoate deaminase
MQKEIIYSSKAPEPIGPYSQGIKAGNFVFLSGQIALDAQTGLLVTDNIEAETKMVMHNIAVLLQQANSSFDKVVKTTIFLADMSLFTQVNEVYAKYFNGNEPARETVAVKGLPKNVNVEISVIALT